MSENPYAQPGPQYADTAGPPDARTSVLAVLSFISGLAGLVLCCIPVISPVIGLLGVALGVPALFLISASQGRKRGMGLAITGVILGLLAGAIGAAILVGAVGAGKRVKQQADVLASVEAQDAGAVASAVSARVQSEVTPATVADFRADYHSEIGAFQQVPAKPLEWAKRYWDASVWEKTSQLSSSYSGLWPVPADFDQQAAFVLLAWDRDSAAFPPELLNLGVLLPDGNVIWLLPAPQAQTPPGPDLAPSPAPSAPQGEPGGEPEAPAGEPGEGGDEGGEGG